MRIVSFQQFTDDFGAAAKQTMDLSIYHGNFDCACGKPHRFDEHIDVICQGWNMKIMVACPNNPTFLTSIKIKTFMVFKFMGFESLAGTKLQSEEEIGCMYVMKRMFARFC